MLRLEKKSRNQGIHISVRENRGLFTRNFLNALAIAFGLHAVGLFIFHVTPFTIGHVDTLFPPVQVKIDYQPLIDQGVLAELESDSTSTSMISEPKKRMPVLQKLSQKPLARRIVYPKESEVAYYPFEKMEAKQIYQDSLPLSPREHADKPIFVRISGALAEKPFIPQPSWEQEWQQMNVRRKEGERYLAVYRVKVEDRTGKVIWFQSKNSVSKRKLREFSEKVLSKLTFVPQPKGFITEGEVELEVTL